VSLDRTADAEKHERVDDPTMLVARLELLEAENERLRRELSNTRRTRYRRATLGTAAIGTSAVLGAILFPAASTVLLSLGGTGLFIAVLIRYLTPERFISATVGRDVYEALSANEETLTDELALEADRVYVPIEGSAGPTVRLFVPQHPEYVIPDDEELESILVLPAAERGRGVAFEPTGGALVNELRSATEGELANDLETLADQLVEGLTEAFELVDRAEPDVDRDDGRLSITISNSTYGPVDRFDHPVASLIATAVAAKRETPTMLEITDSGEDRYVVTCRVG
jgi:hypothetical protein